MLDTWINSGLDDAVFQIEAAGDAPGEFPELVLRTPEGTESFEFGAQAFFAVADADVDHVVRRAGFACFAGIGCPRGFGDDQFDRGVALAQGLVVAIAHADEAFAEAFGEFAGAVLAWPQRETGFHSRVTDFGGAG